MNMKNIVNTNNISFNNEHMKEQQKNGYISNSSNGITEIQE